MRPALSFANKPSDGKQLTDTAIGANNEAMPTMLLCVFRFVRLLWSGHQSIAIENAALRLQLRALRRTRKRPMLTMSDRLFWSALAMLWSGWRDALVIVQLVDFLTVTITFKSIVRVRGYRPSPARGPALQSHGSSDGRMDRTAGDRSLCLPGYAEISDS